VAALFVIGSIHVAGCSRLESIAPLLAGGLAAPEGQTEIAPLVTAEGVEVAILVVGADGLSLAMHPSQATATAGALALPPTPTPISQATMPLVKVTAQSLNVRAGPGVEHRAVGVVHSGQQLAVLGANPDGTWLHVTHGVEVDGWVSAHYVAPVADTSLPTPTPREELASPPAPGPMPTGTTAPSHTPTSAPTESPPTESPDIPTGAPTETDAIPTPSPATEQSPAGEQEADTPSPSPAVASATPVVHAIRVPSPSYGVAAHLLGSDDVRQAALSRVEELGFDWVKVQIRWLDYEGSSKGSYTWDWLDPIVAQVHGRGLNLMISVIAAPEWARPAADDLSINGVPENPQDLGDFLAAMVARYPGQIAAIEVWNEQNLGREVGFHPDANQYVDMLKAGYRSIKDVDPGVIVVSGGLTPTGTDDGYVAIADRRYLDQMLAAGAAGYADAIGAHPSGYNLPPDANWRNPPPEQCGAFEFSCSNPHPSWSFKATLEDYHQILANHGVDRQIWVTEFGWAVCGVPPAGYEYCQDNTGWEQREWLRRSYGVVKEWGWDWVGVMFVWNLNYAQAAPGTEMAMFSILDTSGNPTEAFEGLKGLE